MKNLKGIAAIVNDDISTNLEWFDREVSFVIDGSHNSGYEFYKQILDTLDTSKKNYGKRGANLIATVGLQCIIDIYKHENLNHSQALSIWHYLTKENQATFTQVVKDYLEILETEMAEG